MFPALLLLALPAAALTSDLAVTLEAPATTRPGEILSFQGTVVNNGPDAAEHVLIDMALAGAPNCYSGTDIGTLLPGVRRTFTCSVEVPTQIYRPGLWFSAYTETDQENANNSAVREVLVITPADLRVWGYVNGPAIPGLITTIQIYYANVANTPADSATLTMTTEGIFASVPENCTASGGQATCNLGTIDTQNNPTAPKSFFVDVVAPDASATHFDLDLAIEGNEADPFEADNTYTLQAITYRTSFVTSTAPDGSGSLRAAIEQTNAECTDSWPCLIAFRIPPVDGARWHTIRPATALPWIVAKKIEIDGTTQRLYFSDANPDGPEIEIAGSEVDEGSGLAIPAGCSVAVRGLVINGFPTAGVVAGTATDCPQPEYGFYRAIEGNYIGTDATGARAIPNGLGVYVDGGWRVEANTISGNRRSGVFAQRGINLIRRNTIGLTSALTAPLGNGASGVFIGPAAGGTDVADNYIGFNHHFGVAIDAVAENVAIVGNSFQANGQLAIDRGLDGVTTTGIPLPEIISARVEDGVTIIEIDPGAAGGTFDPRVQVYASDAVDPTGYGEGQYTLGEANKQDERRYLLRFPSDLRGKWIAATTTRVVYNGWLQGPRLTTLGDTGWGYYTTTSEFGRAVQVQ